MPWRSILQETGTALILAIALLAPYPSFSKEKKTPPKTVLTVYDNQGAVQERELLDFLNLLPKFREWAHQHSEEAHPTLTRGRPDFLYSENAAQWVRQKGWEPRRFFCVMGRMAAALMIAEEGSDLKGTRPADMPEVSRHETNLVRRHLGKMLEAGGAAAPKVEDTPPKLPQRR